MKNLGLNIDMLFDEHANEITSKVIGTQVYINQVSSQFDKYSTGIVIQALVLSVLNYCIEIWGTTNSYKKQRM